MFASESPSLLSYWLWIGYARIYKFLISTRNLVLNHSLFANSIHRSKLNREKRTNNNEWCDPRGIKLDVCSGTLAYENKLGKKYWNRKMESAMRGSSTSGQKTHTLKQVCCARQYRASSWKIKSHKKLRKTRISFRMPKFSLFLSVSTVISGLFSICHHTCMHTCVAHTHTHHTAIIIELPWQGKQQNRIRNYSDVCVCHILSQYHSTEHSECGIFQLMKDKNNANHCILYHSKQFQWKSILTTTERNKNTHIGPNRQDRN